ncbi:tail fiber [Bacillus phage Stills]|uniref:Tail fiber n=1 Tax=Bacillus phage Stills TaxID=1610833 RepID=A0A0E3T5K6_9CAUD|nr:tail fiber protein [Bacillus phage Stills]AKC02681.1 tail fiber [Bacillus phage Stills]
MEGRLKQTIRHPKMEVLVDFNGLGLDRINEWENITDYVLDISGSKEKATESVGGVTSDIVTFATDNKGNVFSNTNPKSPFYQKVKSNTKFVLKTGFKGEELKIYAAGIITKFAPSWNDKKYNVSAEDFFYLLKNTDAPKTAYQDISLEELVNVLLDTAEIPSQINRIIPKTEFNFQYFKFEEPDCFSALKKLMEISVGQAYFEGLNFVFETKLALDYELDLTVKHTIEEDDIFTFDETVEDSDIINAVSIISNPKTIYPKELVFQTPENIVQVNEEPVTFGTGTSFYIDNTHLPIINNAENPISVKNLTQGRTININSVDINTGKITIHPESLAYVAQGDLLVVSYSYQQLVLLPGQTRTYSLSLSGEVHALTDVDVAVWDATGQLPREYSTTPNKANTVSLNQFTFNQTSGLVTVVLKNNYAEGITISTLQLRGNPIKSANPLEIYVRDLPSIDEYKKQELQITNNYFTNTKLAQKIAQFIVDNRSITRKKIGVDMDGYTELELNDIAKVIENESGTNHTFYADRIDYSFSSDGGWSAKVTFTQTETEQWVYESFKGESWEKTNPGNPIDDFIFEINANMVKNGGAELHTGIADYVDAGAVGSAHYVPDYWRFTRSTGNASARIRTGGELALHADQSFEITTSNSGSGYYEQTLTGVVPSKTHSVSFIARLDGCSGVFIVEQYEGSTLLKTLSYDLPEGLKEYEFQFASESTADQFIIKFKKNAGTKGSESMIFDKVKVEEAEKASLYLEANETQTVQAGQKYDNSVIIGNNYGVSVYDANNNQRVRMGQYAPGKYGMRIDNGALEIVNGLLYEQLATDVGKKLNISENNAITSLATSMSGIDGELGTISGTIESHASLIQQNSIAISQRVLTTTYTTDKNGILQRLSDAETAIDQTAENITLLATQESFNELGEIIEANTAAINVNAQAITQRVTTSTFNQAITDTKKYADDSATAKAGTAEANAKAASEKNIWIGTSAPTDTTRKWLDTNTTIPILKYYTGGAWKKLIPTAASEVGAETPTGAQTKATAAEKNAKDYMDGMNATIQEQFTAQSSSISVLAGKIDSKVESTTYTQGIADAKSYADGKAATAESNAKGYADGKDAVIVERVETNESLISQQADKILSMVTKTEFNSLKIGGQNKVTGTDLKDISGWTRWNVGTLTLGTADSSIPKNYLKVETKDASGNNLTVASGQAIGIQHSGRTFKVIAGQKYTASMIIATSELGGILDYLYMIHKDGQGNMRLNNVDTSQFVTIHPAYSGAPSSYDFKLVYFTFTADRTDDVYLLIGGTTKRALGSTAYAWIRFYDFKVEDGDKATAWTPSTEDVKQDISTLSTAIKQTAEDIELNVVKNNKVLTSINASSEGVKIKADRLDITGLVTFNVLNSDMQSRISNADQAYADTARWKLPNTTLINGGLIAADTVTASQILVGSWENLFQNGNFEKKTAGWKDASAWSVVNSPNTAYNGNYHAKGTWGSSSSISYYDDREITVRGGETYYFEGYFRTDIATTTPTRTMLILMNDKLGNRTYIIKEETLTTSWKKFSYTFDIPSDIVSIQIGLSVKSGQPSGYATYVDNLFCKKMVDGSLIVDGSITASMIKSLNGLNVGGGQFVVDGTGNVVIGAGATLKAAKFEGLRGNTISFGDYGAKIDTSIAGVIKRTRFATNDSTYLAIDDDGRFNFVTNTNFDCYVAPASGGHYVLKLGSAMIKGLGTGGTMQVRNYDDSLYGDLAAKDLTATGNLDVWGRGTLKGTDLTIQGTTGGMLKLKGSPYAYTEFYANGTQVGFIGLEAASGQNNVMLQNNNGGEVLIKTAAVRVKFDRSVGQVVFKDQNDNGYVNVVGKEFVPNSLRERKKDIKPFTLTSTGKTALEELCETTIFNYRFLEETDVDPLRMGLIYDSAPFEVVDITGQGISLYGMAAFNFQATKELNAKLEEKINVLETTIDSLAARIAVLEGK